MIPLKQYAISRAVRCCLQRDASGLCLIPTAASMCLDRDIPWKQKSMVPSFLNEQLATPGGTGNLERRCLPSTCGSASHGVLIYYGVDVRFPRMQSHCLLIR